MPYENSERVKAFYENVFGWKMNLFWPEMGNYITAFTSETDEHNMVKTPWTINWGFYEKMPKIPTEPSVVIAVENIKEAISEVKKAWGEVVGAPIDIPWVWAYVSFFDTEGNKVSILQPLRV